MKLVKGNLILSLFISVILFSACEEKEGKNSNSFSVSLPGIWEMVTAAENDLLTDTLITLAGSKENRMYYIFNEEQEGYIIYYNTFSPIKWRTEGPKIIQVKWKNEEETSHIVHNYKPCKGMKMEFTTADSINFCGNFRRVVTSLSYNLAGEWKLSRIKGWQNGNEKE